MRKLNIIAAAALASGLLGTSVGAIAQSSSQSSSSQSALPSAPTPVAPPKDKTKPGTTPATSPDQSAAPVPASPQSDSPQTSAPSTPSDAPQAPSKKPSTADDNPFPEDISAAAAKAANAETPNAPSNPTPGEKQANGSSSLDNTDKLGLDDPARKQLKLGSPDGTTDIYDPKRATEDVKVGKFYMQTGYFKGAYERFKDATTFDHENVEAVFYLAEAAQKLNLAKEAQQNYQLYLAAVPDGPGAKAARKALGELGSNSKP